MKNILLASTVLASFAGASFAETLDYGRAYASIGKSGDSLSVYGTVDVSKRFGALRLNAALGGDQQYRAGSYDGSGGYFGASALYSVMPGLEVGLGFGRYANDNGFAIGWYGPRLQYSFDRGGVQLTYNKRTTGETLAGIDGLLDVTENLSLGGSYLYKWAAAGSGDPDYKELSLYAAYDADRFNVTGMYRDTLESDDNRYGVAVSYMVTDQIAVVGGAGVDNGHHGAQTLFAAGARYYVEDNWYVEALAGRKMREGRGPDSTFGVAMNWELGDAPGTNAQLSNMRNYVTDVMSAHTW